MNGTSADGVQSVIVDELARDAMVRGVEGLVEIEVRTGGDRRPEYGRDGDTLVVSGVPILRISVPHGIAVTVREAAGDLSVQNLLGDLTVHTVYGELRLSTVTGVVQVRQVNGGLRAEGVAALRLEGVCNGDLRLQDCGDVTAQTVSGDLRLYRCANVVVEYVRGDLWAEKQSGNLEIDQADGDARLSEIAGYVKLNVVRGDLRAAGLVAGLRAPAIAGDVHLQGPYESEQPYEVSAGGDGNVRIPERSDLRLSVSARGRIRSDLQLSPAHDGTPSYSCILGRGVTPMSIDCAGDLRIGQGGELAAAGAPPNVSDLGEHIRQQVAASLAAAGITFEGGEVRWSPSGRRGPRGREGRAPGPGNPPPPPRSAERGSERGRSAAKSVSAEEQMMILRMVSEGTITPEEAEALLRALGT